MMAEIIPFLVSFALFMLLLVGIAVILFMIAGIVLELPWVEKTLEKRNSPMRWRV